MDLLDRPNRQFIGCSTDSMFTLPTCTMLSSLDDNGDIPDATVLVADFGLSANDRWMIRRSAGRLGHALRFVPIERNDPRVILPNFDFPFPLCGRFVLPSEIDVPRARMVLLDSDMIINASIKPLFDKYMEGHIVAAVHDALAVREHWGRPANSDYFNAGMMMVDVDRFREEDLGTKSMQQLAKYAERPRFLDQDAINDVLGGRWLRLDRTWNFYHAADPVDFTLEDYELCKIAHFCGAKPWEISHHPATPLWARHTAAVERKTRYHFPAGSAGLDRDFAATCYEVFLNRDLDSELIFEDRANFSREAFVRSVIASEEFINRVVVPLAQGEAIKGYINRPNLRQRYWAMDYMPICETTASRIYSAKSWSEFLGALVEDRLFMIASGSNPVAPIRS